MNSLFLIVAILAMAIVGVHLLWRSRYQSALDGIETSLEWESNSATQHYNFGHEVLISASETAGVSPDELPDEIKRLTGRVEELETTVDGLRENWARSLWTTLQTEPVSMDEPHAIHISIPGGTSDDARALARYALTNEQEIAIITAEDDGSFAVGVGESIAEDFPADSVAADLIELVGRGGSNGTDRLASGGGADAETIVSCASNLRDRLSQSLPNPNS